MAIGTITVDEQSAGVGPIFFDRVHFAGDGSYPTNGTAGILAALQAKIGADKNIVAVLPQDCGGYVAGYDHANDKLKVYRQTAATSALIEVPNTTDLSGTTFNLVIVSK